MGTGTDSPGVRGQGDGPSPAVRHRRPDAKLRRYNRGGRARRDQTRLAHSRHTSLPPGTDHPRGNSLQPVIIYYIY